ncbi:hypothetical protein [Burkholderia ambifaria]|nr:hypothetical protein [Burkholderia ambifaria]
MTDSWIGFRPASVTHDRRKPQVIEVEIVEFTALVAFAPFERRRFNGM